MKKFLTVLLLVCFTAMMAAPVASIADGKININTASAKELTQLKKVGPKTAENIVAYRNANGPFKSVQDLKKVKGVGDKILELNKGRMTVSEQ